MQSLYNPLLFYPKNSTEDFLRCFMWFIILSAKKKTLSRSGSSGLNSHFPEGRAGTQTLFPGPRFRAEWRNWRLQVRRSEKTSWCFRGSHQGAPLPHLCSGMLCSWRRPYLQSTLHPGWPQWLSGISGETPAGPDLWTNTPGNPKMNFCQSLQK